MALLEVFNIKKSFGKTEVLKGISFDLEKGDVVAIIGSSGSGKTTLLRCLNFLEKADEGTFLVGDEVLFDANSIKKEKESELRRKRLHFGLVFQSFNLFPQYNALQNVMLASNLLSKEAIKNKINEKAPKNFFDRIVYKIKSIPEYKKELGIEYAKNRDLALQGLARVGLSEKIDNYPHELSGGQQQRVAIARALALNPDILCFDEPTSALDPELTGEVLKVIKDLKNYNSTMIIVTHEMEFARDVADKIIFMADGVIEEMGTPEEVFGNPKSQKTKQFLKKYIDNANDERDEE